MRFIPKHPDSWAGKIFLIGVDKLVLGLFATVIVITAQQCAEEANKVRQQRIVAAQLESKFISSAVNAVTGEMAAYYRIVRKVTDLNRPANNNQITELSDRRDAVKGAIGLLTASVGPEIASENSQKSFKELLDSMNDLNLSLRENNDQGQLAKKALEVVNESYRKVLMTLRDAALDAVEFERTTGTK